jgi:hypothetical protein
MPLIQTLEPVLRETFYASPQTLAPALAPASQIATKLFSVIQSRRNSDTIEALGEFVVILANEQPESVETLAQALRILETYPATPQIKIGWHDGELAQFSPLFRMHLHQFIADAIMGNTLDGCEHDNFDVDDSSPCLTASLLSAAAIKNGLLESPKIAYDVTIVGLLISDAVVPAEHVQIYASSACLHLLVAGSIMMRSFDLVEGQLGILNALKSLRDRREITSPTVVALLEVSSANTLENKWFTFYRHFLANDFERARQLYTRYTGDRGLGDFVPVRF